MDTPRELYANKNNVIRVYELKKSMYSFFMTILNILGERSAVSSIWKLKAPPRVLVFGWLALRNRIPTMDLLSRRGMTFVNGCPMCSRDEESVNHLLLNCKTA
eukprot:TRINITY_DN14229_c0_g1_i1.p2 TRINITY_DN14229_c0_g1~~TRINITY_DN14229_c0_g1_i1.p2  ORF type:complete len:103 (-),score=10.74 TRINITY_DN14229_c0_g1_i1:200-508(-)